MMLTQMEQMPAFQRSKRQLCETAVLLEKKASIPQVQAKLPLILTSEQGSREDYVREFGDAPFGLLVRRIAKMDHQAAMEAFSWFINDESLNDRQIAFVKKVIHHIEQNGYMENVGELLKPPFDKPVSFVKLFDQRRRTELTAVIQAVRENATNVMEA